MGVGSSANAFDGTMTGLLYPNAPIGASLPLGGAKGSAVKPLAQCQKSARRMMIGIGTPKSHSRMPLPMTVSLSCSRCEDTIIPGAVTEFAALGSRKACG